MKTRNTQKGAALLTILGIISIMVIVSTMLAYTAQQQTRSSIITRDMLKARMIAESGLNKAYHAIKSDFSKAEGYALSENFDAGSYKVLCKTFSGDKANRAQLTASGVCGMGSVIVGADLENIPLIISEDDDDDNYYSMAYDVQVGGEMTFTGAFEAHVSEIHSNGDANINKKTSIVGATTVSSAQTAWPPNPPIVGVTFLSNQPSVEIFPASLQSAINKFIDYATQNGSVYASGSEIPANPPGGVSVCTGSSEGWTGEGTGCFIFLGDFPSKHVNITAPNGYPSLIALTPNEIKFNAGAVLNGPVLAPNATLKFNGDATIRGPLLVGQGFIGLGTAQLYDGSGQGFNLPPEESQEDNVIITAWY